jgi:hypothetical protein
MRLPQLHTCIALLLMDTQLPTEEQPPTRPSSSVPTPASYSCSTPSAASSTSSTTSSPSTAKRKSATDLYSSVAKRHQPDLQTYASSSSLSKRPSSAPRLAEPPRKNSSTSEAQTPEEPNAVCRASCRYFPRNVLLLSLTGGKSGNEASAATHCMGEMATRVKSCDFILKAGKTMGLYPFLESSDFQRVIVKRDPLSNRRI